MVKIGVELHLRKLSQK